MEPLTIIIIAALVLSIVAHEAAHGYAADWLGDPTARLAGRLTVNPIAHIDLIGSIIVPGFLYLSQAGFLFGWAKPVPYNPYNLKNQRWGEAMVAAAGPLTNILIAVVFAVFIRSADTFGLSPASLEIASAIVYLNLLLALFNMVPVPPLDGSKILAAILPYGLAMRYRALADRMAQYGFLATFIFIFVFIYILWQPFSVVVSGAFRLLTGL